MRGLHALDKHLFARLCTDSDEFYFEDVTCRVRSQLREHLVAAVPTGLVLSARGVATREDDFQVQRQIDSFPESQRQIASHLLVFGGQTSRSLWRYMSDERSEIPDRSCQKLIVHGFRIAR